MHYQNYISISFLRTFSESDHAHVVVNDTYSVMAASLGRHFVYVLLAMSCIDFCNTHQITLQCMHYKFGVNMIDNTQINKWKDICIFSNYDPAVRLNEPKCNRMPTVYVYLYIKCCVNVMNEVVVNRPKPSFYFYFF